MTIGEREERGRRGRREEGKREERGRREEGERERRGRGRVIVLTVM